MIHAVTFMPDSIDVFSIIMRDGTRKQDTCKVYQSFGNGDYVPAFRYTKFNDIQHYSKIGRLTNINKK